MENISLPYDNKSFFGYSSEDIRGILNYVYPDQDNMDKLRSSMDLRLVSFLKEIISCLDENNEKTLSIYRSEILRLLDGSVDHKNLKPNISNITHVPNWIIVLFVPFRNLALYINIQSDLYRRLVNWRFSSGK
jgi:hypothetical protein